MLNDREQKSLFRRFLFILKLVIIFIYLDLGLAFIFSNNFNKLLPVDPERFTKKYQLAIGVIFILYGLIRFGRLLRKNNEI